MGADRRRDKQVGGRRRGGREARREGSVHNRLTNLVIVLHQVGQQLGRQCQHHVVRREQQLGNVGQESLRAEQALDARQRDQHAALLVDTRMEGGGTD